MSFADIESERTSADQPGRSAPAMLRPAHCAGPKALSTFDHSPMSTPSGCSALRSTTSEGTSASSVRSLVRFSRSGGVRGGCAGAWALGCRRGGVAFVPDAACDKLLLLVCSERSDRRSATLLGTEMANDWANCGTGGARSVPHSSSTASVIPRRRYSWPHYSCPPHCAHQFSEFLVFTSERLGWCTHQHSNLFRGRLS